MFNKKMVTSKLRLSSNSEPSVTIFSLLICYPKFAFNKPAI